MRKNHSLEANPPPDAGWPTGVSKGKDLKKAPTLKESNGLSAESSYGFPNAIPRKRRVRQKKGYAWMRPNPRKTRDPKPNPELPAYEGSKEEKLKRGPNLTYKPS